MTEIPEMPKDFWPEILVIGKYEGNELAFALQRNWLDLDGPEREQTKIDGSVNALRLSLWQAHHLGIKTDA